MLITSKVVRELICVLLLTANRRTSLKWPLLLFFFSFFYDSLLFLKRLKKPLLHVLPHFMLSIKSRDAGDETSAKGVKWNKTKPWIQSTDLKRHTQRTHMHKHNGLCLPDKKKKMFNICLKKGDEKQPRVSFVHSLASWAFEMETITVVAALMHHLAV